MPFYFAYGSNMSSARLRRRVGTVVVHGWATLVDWVHRFDKRGGDGTAKGNIVPRAGACVHGVLYELEVAQLDRLDDFEGGYRRVEIAVRARTAGLDRIALSYAALEESRATGLVPAADYLAHYRRGADEHGLPPEYLESLLRLTSVLD